MKKNKFYKRPWLICIALLAGETAFGCDFQPKTELEQVYCELQDRGASQGLPNIFEFRKNTPKIQALLLNKPARRLGIKIPAPGKTKTDPSPASPSQSTPAPTAEPATADTPEASTSITSAAKSPVNSGLTDCQLNREHIMCGNESYVLQTNRQNRQLAAHALDEQNRLLLPARTAPEYRDKSGQRYLSSIYPYYLEKMLEIGLGDATMSFTKFAATYDDITQQGESFTGRFAKMYELLKTERKSNAIKARYNNNFPTSISQCMRASRTLLVCDDVQQNWIYQIQ